MSRLYVFVILTWCVTVPYVLIPTVHMLFQTHVIFFSSFPQLETITTVVSLCKKHLSQVGLCMSVQATYVTESILK